jgi:hypothetical protein
MPPAMASAVTSTRPHCSGKMAGRSGAKVRRRSRRHIRDTVGVKDAFGIVLVVVVVVGGVAALVAFLGAGRIYEQIGRGILSLDTGPDERAGATAAMREEEIRQLLEARNERRARRGEDPLDVEAELRELTRPRVDPALLREIRDLVVARNERRARRGEPPLDVEAEVEREIQELGNLG